MKPACFILALALSLLIFSCGENKEDNKEAGNKISNNNSSGKDYRLQEYKLEQQKEQALERFPCDTISLKEFVLSHYAPGTYLVDFDKTLTFDIQRSAVIYPSNYPGYIFGIIAKSKSGERYIEPKNIVGYNESFVDLDSTKLGTAFFYLTLFQCDNNRFKIVWEAIIPSHGGFNTFSLEKWKYNKTPYIRVNFHFAQGIGHIDYNYFLIDGLTEKPHLIMTYKGINFQRTILNYNNDKYPDYYEYLFLDSGKKVTLVDSIPFVWNTRKNVYVNTRNNKYTRPY